MVKAKSVTEINASLKPKIVQTQREPPKEEKAKEPRTDYKAKAHELTHQVAQLTLKIKDLESVQFDPAIVEMCVNNYLKGYKKAYENNKLNDLSKVKTDYEKVLKEKLKIIK